MEHGEVQATKASEADNEKSRCKLPKCKTKKEDNALLQVQQAAGNRALGSMIQAKLKVSEPGDSYEQEADRVADHVMRMADPSPEAQVFSGLSTPHLQRMCSECDEEKDEKKSSEEENGTVQAKEVGGSSPQAGGSPEALAGDTRTGGEPLPEPVRNFFEPRFGRDLGAVRIHTGEQAAGLARSIGARAFTLGRDVVFGKGEFSPQSTEGKRLLAHELTHVVQQNRTPDEVGRNVIQRWSFGAAPPAGKIVVPAKHQSRVTAAMEILSGLAADPKCKAFYRDHCTAGLGAAELATALADVEVYEDPSKGTGFGGSPTRNSAADPRKAAYNLTAYAIGRWMIASTLLHEMFHTCILGSIDFEDINAETAVEKCLMYTPFILDISPRSGPVGTVVKIEGFEFGPKQNAADRVTFNGVDAGVADSWILGDPASKKAMDSVVRVKVKVPEGATSGPLVVENNGIPSNGVQFTVT